VLNKLKFIKNLTYFHYPKGFLRDKPSGKGISKGCSLYSKVPLSRLSVWKRISARLPSGSLEIRFPVRKQKNIEVFFNLSIK